MSEWQPIETAPKDGREILGWFGSASVIRWHIGTESFWTDGFMRLREPTHWMPLPEPPETP